MSTEDQGDAEESFEALEVQPVEEPVKEARPVRSHFPAIKDDGKPIEDLERALISKVVDLGMLAPVIWAYHTDVDDFRSPECRQVWRWLINFSPGHQQVPSRDQLRAKFPGFRFVVVQYALLPLAARLFKRERVMGRESPLLYR